MYVCACAYVCMYVHLGQGFVSMKCGGVKNFCERRTREIPQVGVVHGPSDPGISVSFLGKLAVKQPPQSTQTADLVHSA